MFVHGFRAKIITHSYSSKVIVFSLLLDKNNLNKEYIETYEITVAIIIVKCNMLYIIIDKY
jgi:hypothetical protein